jgi:nucleotide-binding universal stress UspA family protein
MVTGTQEDAMREMAQLVDGPDTEAPKGPTAPRMLIALDETPGAMSTLRSGLAQAAAQGAEVTVLHVVAPRRWRVARFGPVRAVPMLIRDPLESPILREARRLGPEHGVTPRLELVASDDVDAVILGTARRLDAAAIVVGASGPDGLVAPLGARRRVLRRAAVPVVVVPA